MQHGRYNRRVWKRSEPSPQKLYNKPLTTPGCLHSLSQELNHWGLVNSFNSLYQNYAPSLARLFLVARRLPPIPSEESEQLMLVQEWAVSHRTFYSTSYQISFSLNPWGYSFKRPGGEVQSVSPKTRSPTVHSHDGRESKGNKRASLSFKALCKTLTLLIHNDLPRG